MIIIIFCNCTSSSAAMYINTLNNNKFISNVILIHRSNVHGFSHPTNKDVWQDRSNSRGCGYVALCSWSLHCPESNLSWLMTNRIESQWSRNIWQATRVQKASIEWAGYLLKKIWTTFKNLINATISGKYKHCNLSMIIIISYLWNMILCM